MGFQPAFAVETIQSNGINTSDNELIKVTFRVCKFNKIIENTVWLTQEESDELDDIIDNVKKDLENVKDRNEENEIYNNAILSFNKLGLIPNNINCEEVNNLVKNDIYHKFRNKLKINSENNHKADILRNWFCSITGESEHTTIFPHITIALFKLSHIVAKFAGNYEPNDFWSWVFLFIALYFSLGAEFFLFKDRSFFSTTIGLGESYDDPYGNYVHFPATGWIVTRGLNGYKNFEGLYYGQLNKYFSVREYRGGVTDYIGVTGFTGTQIIKETRVFYMGGALSVHIGQLPLP
jgi:hypothetical protein